MANFSLGQLIPGNLVEFDGVLDAVDPFDQYSFSFGGNYTSSNGLVVYSALLALFTTSSSDLFLGQDLDGDNFFDADEVIGSPLASSGDPNAFDFIGLPGDFTDSSGPPVADFLFQPGITYFLGIDGIGATVDYIGEILPFLVVAGEITTEDNVYCCDVGTRYYYDEFTDDLLGQEIRVGVGGLLTGQEILFSVASDDFQPILIVFDVATGKVLQATDTVPVESLPGLSGGGFEAQLFLSLEAGISYGVSVETLESGATGSYAVGAAVFS
jgi:hypothetical protein